MDAKATIRFDNLPSLLDDLRDPKVQGVSFELCGDNGTPIILYIYIYNININSSALYLMALPSSPSFHI